MHWCQSLKLMMKTKEPQTDNEMTDLEFLFAVTSCCGCENIFYGSEAKRIVGLSTVFCQIRYRMNLLLDIVLQKPLTIN